MDTSKFEDVWRLMSLYSINADLDSIHEDFTCIICHKLMINACQSSCGCQYCYNCVYRYLGDGDKYCPGGKTSCQEELLVLDRDVFKNMRMNKKILKLKVHCPNDKCPLTMELSLVQDHLVTCNDQVLACPYVMIGCNEQGTSSDKICDHFTKYSLTHSYLLMDYLKNLKQEMEKFKSYCELSKYERSYVDGERRLTERMKRDVIDQMRAENNEMNRERDIYNNVNHIEIENQKGELRIIKEELRYKDEQIEELRRELTAMRNEMEERNLTLTTEAERREELLELQKTDYEAMMTEMNIIGNIVNEKKDRKVKSQMRKESRFNSWIRWNKLLPNLEVDFVWKIEELTLNKRILQCRDIASQPFHVNNYKFCLRQISVVDNVGLYCRIMVGENDNKLAWPMRQHVTISIIDQVSFKNYKSVTYKYITYQSKDAFNKPKDDRCDGIGEWPFILYSAIKNFPTIVVNDSIIVSCTISDPL